jgi:hypothetical protein
MGENTNFAVTEADSALVPFSKEAMTQYLCDFVTSTLAQNQDYFKLCDLWFNDYRDIKPFEKIFPYKGSANYSRPITSTSCDALICRIIEGIIGFDLPLDILALNQTSNQFRDKIKAFMNWDLKAHDNIYEQLWYLAANTVVYGTGYINSFFVAEKRVVSKTYNGYVVPGEAEPIQDEQGISYEESPDNTVRLQQLGVQAQPQKVTEKNYVWDRYEPDMETLDIKDVLQAEDSENIRDSYKSGSPIAVRTWKTLNEMRKALRSDTGEGLFSELTDELINEMDVQYKSNDNDSRKRKEIQKDKTKNRKVELWTIFFDYDVDDDGLEEKCIALVNVNKQLLLGYQVFQYDHGQCPITETFIQPIHKQNRGVGVPEMLYDTKSELDHEHNTRSDYKDYLMNPILITSPNSGFSTSQHRFGLRQHWDLESVSEEDIRFLTLPISGADMVSKDEEERLERNGQKRVGISDIMQGEGDQHNQTKGGILAMIQENNIRIRHYIKWLAPSIRQIFYQRLCLYQQYYNTDDPEILDKIQQILDVPDNPFKMEDMNAMRGKYNVALLATKEEKGTEIQKAQFFNEMIAQDPMAQQVPELFRDIKVDLLRKVGISNADETYPTSKAIQAIMINRQKEALKQLLQERAQEQAKAQGQGQPGQGPTGPPQQP